MSNQAETIFAIVDLENHIKALEQYIAQRLDRLDQGLLDLLGRNQWGLSDDERVLAWRMLQIRLHDADPKDIVHRFPPEEPEKRESPSPLVTMKSVLDA
jgi:hypothetical protein